MKLLIRRLKRALKDLKSRDENEFSQVSSKEPEVRSIASVTSRERATFRGTITSLVVPAFGEQRGLEIELSDGTAVLSVIWLGREKIHSITAGTKIYVSGFVGFNAGRRIMYNPNYAIYQTNEEVDD